MNRVELMGRLTKNPELKYAQNENNTAVARYTLAVDRRGKKDGLQGQTTDFVPCVAFGKAAEFVVKYFKKGIQVTVCGRVLTSAYTGNDGKKIYSTNIVTDEHFFAESRAAGVQEKATNNEYSGETDENGFMKMPDGADAELPLEPFSVLYQTAEDGCGDTIKPRMKACGADLSKVFHIIEDEKDLNMLDERIEIAIVQNGVKLLILDPLQAYIGTDINMNQSNETRNVFKKISRVAERTGCAIVVIGHLNKNSESSSTYRGLGSIDIYAAARSVLLVGRVIKNEDLRVVLQLKAPFPVSRRKQKQINM